MMKKICLVLLLITFISMSVLPAFADTDKFDDELIYSSETKTTKNLFVKITRPDGDESTFKKTYVLCGVSLKDEAFSDLVVKLLVYDEESDSYKEYKNADGEDTWGLGKYGIFIKEMALPNKVENKIRLVIYNDSEKEKLVLGKNLQVNNFTITILDEGIKEKITNGISKISQLLKGIFK